MHGEGESGGGGVRQNGSPHFIFFNLFQKFTGNFSSHENVVHAEFHAGFREHE